MDLIPQSLTYLLHSGLLAHRISYKAGECLDSDAHSMPHVRPDPSHDVYRQASYSLRTPLRWLRGQAGAVLQ